MDRPVLVFQGQTFEAADLQSKLEEAGIPVIPTYLPNVAGSELHVPPEWAEEAQWIVQSEARRIARSTELMDEGGPELDGLRALSKRIRPLALSCVGAPAGFVIGCAYFVRVKRLGRRPAEHGDVILAWTGSAVMSLAVLFFLFLIWLYL